MKTSWIKLKFSVCCPAEQNNSLKPQFRKNEWFRRICTKKTMNSKLYIQVVWQNNHRICCQCIFNLIKKKSIDINARCNIIYKGPKNILITLNLTINFWKFSSNFFSNFILNLNSLKSQLWWSSSSLVIHRFKQKCTST